MLASTLATIHNERFTVRLVDDIRASIEAGTFAEFRDGVPRPLLRPTPLTASPSPSCQSLTSLWQRETLTTRELGGTQRVGSGFGRPPPPGRG